MGPNEENVLIDSMRIQMLLAKHKLSVKFKTVALGQRFWSIPELETSGESVTELLYCLVGYDIRNGGD